MRGLSSSRQVAKALTGELNVIARSISRVRVLRPRKNIDKVFVMGPPEKITVILRNSSSTLTTNEFEVFDNVCNQPVGTFTLKGGESRSIEISQDDTGKGNLKIRNPDLGPNDWSEVPSVSRGDIVTA
jgi:hypothetical protein